MSGGQQVNLFQTSLTPFTAKPQITYSQGFVVPAGNNLEVHLDGVEITYAQGTLFTGIRLESQLQLLEQGTIGSEREKALVGQAITYAQGSIGVGSETEDTSVVLHQGNVALTHGNPLVGQAQTLSQGNLVAGNLILTTQLVVLSTYTILPATTKALVGQAISYQQGTMTPSSPNRTVALVGQVVGYQQGDLLAATSGGTSSKELVGQEVAYSQGNLDANIRGPKGDWQPELSRDDIWTKEAALEV